MKSILFWDGTPAQVDRPLMTESMMGSMTPSGNRLFIQSATHLRCIDLAKH